MKKFLVIALIVLLAGCSEKPVEKQTHAVPDQCLRTELFQQCLSVVPPGPERTVYNDWAEVVDQCEQSAYYRSLRPANTIKPECRASL